MLKPFASAVARECARAREVFLDVLERALRGDRADKEGRDHSSVLYRSDRKNDDERQASRLFDIQSMPTRDHHEPGALPPANTSNIDRLDTMNTLTYELEHPVKCKSCGALLFDLLCDNCARNSADSMFSRIEVSGPPPLCTRPTSEPAPTRSRDQDSTT